MSSSMPEKVPALLYKYSLFLNYIINTYTLVGALQFAKGEYERALANFDFKETVPGMLGRAACKFQQGKYEVQI